MKLEQLQDLNDGAQQEAIEEDSSLTHGELARLFYEKN